MILFYISEDKMVAKKDLPACPVATTVGIIGNKWKILILRDILSGPKRFTELRKSLEGISQKVLTDSLRGMEEDGIVTRTVYPEVPPRVEYSLNEMGDSMRPIIMAMASWGMNYKEAAGKDQ
jgi:DNA-binding HxlR family transcriptional regulator